MTRYLDIYRTQLKTNIMLQLQYRAAMAIWLIDTVLQPLIYLVVWTTVARASGGQLVGFSGGDFASYYIILMVVNHLTFTWIMFVFEYNVRYGQFSFALLRALHPIHTDIAENLGYKVLSLAVILPAVVIMAVAFDAKWQPQLWAVLAFLPALALAFLTRFLLEWTLAQAAFWTTRVDAVNQVFFVAQLFFSGFIAPLALLPAPLRLVANALPLRWQLAFPVDLALGRLSWQQTLQGYAMQGLWLLATFALMRLVWRQGVRRYSAVGQ